MTVERVPARRKDGSPQPQEPVPSQGLPDVPHRYEDGTETAPPEDDPALAPRGPRPPLVERPAEPQPTPRRPPPRQP